MFSLRIVSAVALLLCSSVPVRAEAGEASPVRELLGKLSERWRWRIFDRDEGVSPGVVGSIYWSSDDHLYAATDRGLSRYDLHHWKVVENAEPMDDGRVGRIVGGAGTIYCSSERILWTGVRKLQRVYPDQGAASGPIFIASTRQGQVFLLDGESHFRVRKNAVFRLEGRVPFARSILDYAIDEESIHWVATEEGLKYRDLNRRRWVRFKEPDLPFPDTVCIRLLNVRKLPREPLPQARRLATHELWGVFRARTDAEASYLARLDGRRWVPVSENALTSVADSVTTDVDGHYLVTCDDGRLYALREDGEDSGVWERAESLGVGPAKLHGALLDSRGNLWFRLGAGGVAYVDLGSDRWQRLPGRVGPPYPKVLSLLETVTGDLWVGTDEDLTVYPKAGPEPQMIETANGVALEAISALGEEFRGQRVPGRVWVGSESFNGTLFFERREEGEAGDWGFVSLEESVHRIVTDIRGELWFLPSGSDGGGKPHVYRLSVHTGFEHEFVEVVSGVPGYEPTELDVNDLVRVPSDEDVFWLATFDGLLRARLERNEGRSTLIIERRMTERDGLGSKEIWAAEEGPDGAIWICYPSSGRGVTRLFDSLGETSSSEASVSPRLATHFDVDDGLAGPEVWSILRSGHQLWFATNHGLSRFDGETWYGFPVESADPHSSRVIPILASKEDESLLVGTAERWVLRYRGDDRRRPRLDRLVLPAEVREGKVASFSWRARDYKNHTVPSELIVRYRVDNGEWQDSASDASVDVQTVGLEPGKHVFELEVRDLDGNTVREIGDRVHEFWIRPSDQRWARVAGVMTGMFVLGFLIFRWQRWMRRRAVAAFRYRSFFASSPAAVLLLDSDGTIVDYNGASPESLGLRIEDVSEVCGRPARWIPTLANMPIEKMIESDKSFEYHSTTGEIGSPEGKALRVVGFALGNSGARTRWAVVVSDLSRGREEKQLRERERRLGGIRDFAERLSPELEEVAETLQAIGDQPGGTTVENRLLDRAQRAMESVCSSVSTFTGDSDTARPFSQLSVATVLSSLFEPTNGNAHEAVVVPAKVSLTRELSPDLRKVVISQDLLEGALRAVLQNAIEAVSGDGEIAISAANRDVDGDPGGLPAGPYVEISCVDDGPGMGEDQIHNVFDPLYSTKPRGRARGLGLSTAYATMRAAGGDVRIYSRPGTGTRVTLLIPSLPPAEETPPQHPDAEPDRDLHE